MLIYSQSFLSDFVPREACRYINLQNLAIFKVTDLQEKI